MYNVALDKLREKRTLPLPDMYQLVECIKSADQASAPELPCMFVMLRVGVYH